MGQESQEESDPAQKMAEDQQHIVLAASDHEEKKIIRRDIERQKRVQMSILCQSLRSLLPFELIMGKRSVSDHIGEATNYIKFLKQKMHALQIKRDRLKEMVNLSMLETVIGSSPDQSSILVECVNINPFPGGMEIVIASGFEEISSSPLSDLMEILLQVGCDVVSCVSAQVNGRTFHTIKSEVQDLTRLDLSRLQHKLNYAISLSSHNSVS